MNRDAKRPRDYKQQDNFLSPWSAGVKGVYPSPPKGLAHSGFLSGTLSWKYLEQQVSTQDMDTFLREAHE